MNQEQYQTKYQITYEGVDISFSIKYTQRKSLKISVFKDLSVLVHAPKGESLSYIKQVLQKKAAWIYKQQKYFKELSPVKITPKKYIHGEPHSYCGKEYKLNIVESNKSSVQLENGALNIFSKAPTDSIVIKKQLEKWYRENGKIKFQERLKVCYEKVCIHNIPFPTLKVRKMSRRWGSFSTAGVMTLNTELIKTPVSCIDYVIIHELCHGKYFSHNKDFYNLLETIMPEWKEEKMRLERVKR